VGLPQLFSRGLAKLIDRGGTTEPWKQGNTRKQAPMSRCTPWRMPGNLELPRGGPSEGESAASRLASATRKPAHGDSRGNTAAELLLARGSLGGGSAAGRM
jgi:hypothetical protein